VPHLARPGPVEGLGDQDPLLNVLRAVAVGLLNLYDQTARPCLAEGSVDADTASGGELHHHQPDLLTRRQRVQRISGGQRGADLERGQGSDVEEAGGPGQRRDPQAPRAVPSGQYGEGPVGQEPGDPAV
jgi:hypothetical protein